MTGRVVVAITMLQSLLGSFSSRAEGRKFNNISNHALWVGLQADVGARIGLKADLRKAVEQPAFGTFPGMSASTRVTINGNGNLLTFNATSSTLPYTLLLNGTKFMQINNLLMSGMAPATGPGHDTIEDWASQVRTLIDAADVQPFPTGGYGIAGDLIGVFTPLPVDALSAGDVTTIRSTSSSLRIV